MRLLAAAFLCAALALALISCSAGTPATDTPAPTVPAEASPTAVSAVSPISTPTLAKATGAATEAAAPTEEATPPYPTPNPNPVCVASSLPVDEKVPPVTDADWVKGPADAKITLIEYADFQCPACSGVAPLLTGLVDAQEGGVRLVYRHFPLITIHDKAMITAEAAEAAGAQGKFWEMNSLLFERQSQWSSGSADKMVDVLAGYAKDLALDVDAFREALTKHTYQAKVKQQYDDATTIGLPGTPSLIFNNIDYPLQQLGLSEIAFSFFLDIVRYNDPPPTVIEKGRQYEATIKTDKGDIVMELFADKSPLTVNNFVYLAKQGWYDNTMFHRVIPGFAAQAGDHTNTGAGRPGYTCQDELNQELGFDGPGVVGMANSGPDTNGSQFFITMDAQPTLNGRHPVFGRVTSGMEVVKSLTPRDPQNVEPDAPGDRIVSITIQEK
jgi:cyclophilin family peptidyl-prolyl cis-trans isomerase/protein-disulfide isomerase